MSADGGFPRDVITALARALAPISSAVSSPAEFAALAARLGWPMSSTAVAVDLFSSLTNSIDQLANHVEGGEGTATLVSDVVGVMAALAALRQASARPSAGSPFDNPAFWRALPEDLFGLLVSEALEAEAPGAYGVLSFLGVLRKRQVRADPSTGRDAYVARKIDWAALGRAVASPGNVLTDVYGWGESFDHAAFVEALHALGAGLGAMVALLSVSSQRLAPLVKPDNPERGRMKQLVVLPPVSPAPNLGALVKPALVVSALPPSGAPSEPPEGLLVSPVLTGAAEAEIALRAGAKLHLAGDFQASPVRFGLRPQGVTLESGQADVDLAARIEVAPERPVLLGGAREGTRFELVRAHLGFAVEGSGSGFDVPIDVGLDDARVVLDFGEADGFVRSVLGDGPHEISLTLDLTWSSRDGLRFSGGVAPRVRVPVNLMLGGVLAVSEIEASLATTDTEGAALLTVAATGSLDLGVLALSFDGIGVAVETRTATFEAPGNFGLLDLGFGIKPPDGLGLVVDAGGIVSGGGYLEHDPEKAQYAGVGEIEFVKLGLSAVGVLTTRMPDGSDGWSLFLSVYSEFPPLQIGFGFTLNGVGGLVGLNRTLDDDALRARLLQGALDSIMFPEDPVRNAPVIINDIEAVFPPAKGQFIFGAMMKFGWGTPSLITVDLGVMVELPDPIRIALMGQLESILPTKDVRILELHMDVFGLADLTAQTFALDATIRDSHIVELLTLSGDMALRADLLDQPTMLLSIGGFSPRFKAPATYPSLRLMRASVPVGPLASVDLSCYVAITSNTFQMGGRVDVWAKFAGFSAEGFLEMDALIQFVPFGFQFRAGFGVAVRAGRVTLMGVEVSGDLSGPSPWEVFGTATFEILKLKKAINLEISVGREKKNIAETYNVAALLMDALNDPASWSVPEEDELSTAVRLRERGPDEERAVHPAGRVQVVQRVVPLNTTIEVFGGGKVIGQKQFVAEQVLVGDEARAPAGGELIEDWFAAAQFFKMKEKEKIDAPSFELMDSGVRFGSDGIAGGNTTEIDVNYDEIVLDPKLNQRRRAKFARAALRGQQLSKFRKLGATGMLRARNRRFAEGESVTPKYTVKEQKFVATHLGTGKLDQSVAGAKGKTYAEAASLVRRRNGASLSSLEEFGVASREELSLAEA